MIKNTMFKLNRTVVKQFCIHRRKIVEQKKTFIKKRSGHPNLTPSNKITLQL